MKIAYICYWDLQRLDGVSDKISSQTSRWRSAGHDVDVFSLAPETDGAAEAGAGEQRFGFRGPGGRLAATARLAAAVRHAGADVVYLRYDVFLPPLLVAFGSSKLVVELNSNIAAELRARSRLTALYESAQRRRIFARADGVVAVTTELERAAKRGRPHLSTAVIPNGIELGPVPEARTDGAGPRLVYVGEAAYWQGVDKILELARLFPAWRFDLVGVRSGTFPANVTNHGFLERDEYASVLARADVAIGTLALHRKQMEEASPLKVRRYLEFGLPLILGYSDTDLTGLDPWWLLTLPNVESNVSESSAAIESFVDAVAGRRIPRGDVEPLISAAAKEERRLEFFATVLGQGRAASSDS